MGPKEEHNAPDPLKDKKSLRDELAAARADRPAPYGRKGYLDDGDDDTKKADRAAKIAIRCLRRVTLNMALQNYGKETRELALLAQLELENLYE